MSAVSFNGAESSSPDGEKAAAKEVNTSKEIDREIRPAGEENVEDAKTTPKSDETPPLPDEDPPPLPNEAPPGQAKDDGWEPVWDDNAQAYYFYNRFTNVSQWENPRVPESQQAAAPGVGNHDRLDSPKSAALSKPVAGGYDPSIHGDYDPNADYAKAYEATLREDGSSMAPGTDSSQLYTATGAFNRFTGKWQNAELTPDKFSDESKSRRQMNAFFDVDAAANSHDGRSLKAERAGKKLSKKELKAFRDKRREKKEEKRRAWLRD